MALDSTSTLSDALAQYSDNLSWEGNPTKAVLFLEAIRWLLVRRAYSTSTADGKSVSFSELKDQESKVQSYVKTSSANTRRCSFTRGRALMP